MIIFKVYGKLPDGDGDLFMTPERFIEFCTNYGNGKESDFDDGCDKFSVQTIKVMEAIK